MELLAPSCARIAFSLSAVLLAAPLVAISGSAHVRLPSGFADQSVALDVSGHSPRRFNEPVRFGPYSALEMREGTKFSWGFPVGAVDVGRTSKPYAYTLVARDLPPVEVQCRLRAWTAGAGRASRRAELDLTPLAGPLMACEMRMDGTQQPGRLEMARIGTRLNGTLTAPWGDAYPVRSLSGFAESSWPSSEPTGYEIATDRKTVSVVDVLNAGRVHLDSQLSDEHRVYLAAAAAALLLLDAQVEE